MSLFGTLNTAVSGLAAQAGKLGTIGDNISNSSTTGYKQAGVEFETLLGNQGATSYESGGVQTRVRYDITAQGAITGTTSVTDLAIKGNGFFVVQGDSGAPALTRAGSFVPDAFGNLINAAGFKLMGYNLLNGSTATANGTGGLQAINLSSQSLTAGPSKTGTLSANLPSNAAVATAPLPSANSATSSYTDKTSLVAYDNLGNAVTLDVYLTKTGANTWQADVYNQASAAPGGGFPYSSAELGGSQTLAFSGTTGKLTSGSPLSVPIPNGSTLSLDVSQVTQLATNFMVNTANVDGTAPSKLDHITIGTDGTVTSVYQNGAQQAIYRIPLANVASPDQLSPLTGNVYEPSTASGGMTIGTAKTGSLGEIDSSSLEQSTVDLATELTSMITAQRSYEANSKVIQASSDLLSVVSNLKA
jgi:flagellar hook protein FlgE